MEEEPTRKLAVLLHADVVHSTELVRRDETLAHHRIQDAFRRLSETVSRHGGVAHEVRGDALVAEFSKASDAVAASIDFHTANAVHNQALSDDIRPVVRVGIAMGEVLVADNTVTGEGVVLAQRLEQLAEPGGVCIQGAAYETVPKRLPFVYDDIGEHQLKGFDQPVKVYAVREASPPASSIDSSPGKSGELELPEGPSIAVLPFTNMSSDPEQEFFSDGVTEDIITALSKTSAMLVIARNSTFTYKGKAVDVRQVGREQGVRYVLEGSVRKAGNRVRVTAQLIDATTSQHKWAERYDRDLEDIFAVQDEITRSIVSALDVRLSEGEQARFWSSGTLNLDAWECVRVGLDLLNGYRAEDIPGVLGLAQRAIDLDPDYAAAWVLSSWAYFHKCDDRSVSKKERDSARESVGGCAQRALEIDATCAEAHSALGLYYLSKNEIERAVAQADKAVELAPNHADILAIAAAIMNKSGQPEKATDRVQKAMRLSPVYPTWFLGILGQSSRLTGNFERALDAFQEMIRRQTDSLGGHINLAATYGEMDRTDEAMASAREVLRIAPDFSIEAYLGELAYSDPAETERFGAALRKAGLPD